MRAGREQTGELRETLLGIAAEYKKQAHKEELQRGEHPRSKKRKNRAPAVKQFKK